MTNDVQMPFFGKASGAGATQTDWGEVDNLDVELLAEYLLDDSAAAVGGVTFDFSIESGLAGSGVVSPENSEDGALPPVAEAKPYQQQAFAATSGLISQPALAPAGQVPLAPLPSATATAAAASTTFPTLPAQVAKLPNPGAMYVQQQAAASAADSVPKRRRVENPAAPMMAIGGHPGAATLLNGQQLAAAAAQVLQPGRGRKKSQAQIDRRRERNRILARRTRLRKKFFFESLQKEVLDLQRENVMLKELVKTNINEVDSKKILDSCDAQEKLPESVMEAVGENAGDIDSQDFNLVRSIQGSQHSFIITDPSLQDNPIVFASDEFMKLTGYSREQILGRNCRFLQGTETSKEKVEMIRKNLSNGEDVSVTLINYTADGTPFWNKLFVAALRDAQNNIVNFIGVTVKVASPEPGDPEFGKALPGQKVDSTTDGLEASGGMATALASS